MNHRWIVLAFLCFAASCSSLAHPFGGSAGSRTPTNADEAKATMALADQDFAKGRTQEALDRALLCRDATGLPTDLRNEIELKVESFAEKRIDELSVVGSKPSKLEDLVELNLPRNLAVRAGVRAAELSLEQHKPYDSFKVLQKLDTKFPNHYERVRAGQILAEAGMQLAHDDWSFLGFFRTRDDGAAVLEYLVINYPKEPRCDQAYSTLATLYARDRDWELARQRCEDLLLYHPDSALAAWAEASVPHYRLLDLKSPEYDRRELIRADGELDQWLKRHAKASGEPSALEHEVRVDYADCLVRLCRSDIGVAKFYRRIDRSVGARLYSDRAVEEAKKSGVAELVAEAAELQRAIATMPAEPAGAP